MPNQGCPEQTQPTPPLIGTLPTGQLLELRQDRLKEVIVDLVGGTVVPDEEEIVYRHGVRGTLPQCQAVPGTRELTQCPPGPRKTLSSTPMLRTECQLSPGVAHLSSSFPLASPLEHPPSRG
ncbi:hypothetical protein I79_000999 [Cricetulus griseus]|uniref:Uncharacterized protein n=1 Tax=Cricetulus griseus TaxID=10029 RepID=G3GTL4_CRIGR|nr:hypothetical protein I79_000999 [Cricetulus griseus]